jgi:hypothetical protein
MSRPALRPIQPAVHWVPGALSMWVKRGRGVTLTTYPHPVPRSIMNESYTSSPPKHLHCGSRAALFFLFFYILILSLHLLRGLPSSLVAFLGTRVATIRTNFSFSHYTRSISCDEHWLLYQEYMM